MNRTLLITGGAGFIGSALVRKTLPEKDCRVVVVDKLTYAGSLDSIASALTDDRFTFEKADICDEAAIRRIVAQYRPDAVFHLAAESHVDRSIDGPAAFIETNILGTYTLLEASRRYWEALHGAQRESFRFVHVSTDEVFGSLGRDGQFTEETAYDPRSPYSSSKASSDHLARAWHHTYGLPVIVTNCSNNYGPFQYPEKLIPVVVQSAIRGKPIPVYGRGENVRDWLHVDDHVRALRQVLDQGVVGATYAIGAGNEWRNVDLIRRICAVLDELVEAPAVDSHESLIDFVNDRPGHDWRYSIDSSKIRRELGWAPRTTFDSGLRETVRWYLDNQAWCEKMLAGASRSRSTGAGDGEARGRT